MIEDASGHQNSVEEGEEKPRTASGRAKIGRREIAIQAYPVDSQLYPR